MKNFSKGFPLIEVANDSGPVIDKRKLLAEIHKGRTAR